MSQFMKSFLRRNSMGLACQPAARRRPSGTVLATLASILVLLLVAPAARAGDEPEHRYLTYALAIAAGFPPDEAKVISDGAWSTDMNDTTTALTSADPPIKESIGYGWRVHKFKGELQDSPQLKQQFCKDDAYLAELVFSTHGDSRFPRVGRGAFYHALFDDPLGNGQGTPATPSLYAPWKAYIDDQLTKLDSQGKDASVLRRYRLVLFGQYLHVLLDSFVHPPNPWYGHAPFHTVDYAVNNPDWFKAAAKRLLAELRSLRFQLPYRAGDLSKSVQLSHTDMFKFTEQLVDALVEGYGGTSWVRNSPLGGLSAKDKANTRAAIDKKMQEFLGKKGYTDKALVKGFKVPDYTHINYQAKPGSGDFEVTYGQEKGPDLDNFINWILKRAKAGDKDAQHTVDLVRKNIRTDMGCTCSDCPPSSHQDRARQKTPEQRLAELERRLQGRPGDTYLLEIARSLRADLEAERKARIQKMTPQEKLDVLERELPGRIDDPLLLENVRRLRPELPRHIPKPTGSPPLVVERASSLTPELPPRTPPVSPPPAPPPMGPGTSGPSDPPAPPHGHHPQSPGRIITDSPPTTPTPNPPGSGPSDPPAPPHGHHPQSPGGIITDSPPTTPTPNPPGSGPGWTRMTRNGGQSSTGPGQAGTPGSTVQPPPVQPPPVQPPPVQPPPVQPPVQPPPVQPPPVQPPVQPPPVQPPPPPPHRTDEGRTQRLPPPHRTDEGRTQRLPPPHRTDEGRTQRVPPPHRTDEGRTQRLPPPHRTDEGRTQRVPPPHRTDEGRTQRVPPPHRTDVGRTQTPRNPGRTDKGRTQPPVKQPKQPKQPQQTKQPKQPKGGQGRPGKSRMPHIDDHDRAFAGLGGRGRTNTGQTPKQPQKPSSTTKRPSSTSRPPVSKPPVRKPPVRKPPKPKKPVVRKPPVSKPPVRKPPVRKPPVRKPPVSKPPVRKPPVSKPPSDGRARARMAFERWLKDYNARVRQLKANRPDLHNVPAVHAYNARARALNAEGARLDARARALGISLVKREP